MSVLEDVSDIAQQLYPISLALLAYNYWDIFYSEDIFGSGVLHHTTQLTAKQIATHSYSFRSDIHSLYLPKRSIFWKICQHLTL